MSIFLNIMKNTLVHKGLLVLLMISAMLSVSVRADDYFNILGIKRNAKEADIRKAYKKLRAELNPELPENLGNEEKYMIYEKLDRAHFVLTDVARK